MGFAVALEKNRSNTSNSSVMPRARSRVHVHVQEYMRELNHHRQVYGFAHRILITLWAESAENSEHYKPVLLRDLQTSTIIFNLSALGQRNQWLAWFWSTPALGEKANDDLLTECEWSPNSSHESNGHRSARCVG
jgi:hypothetical protein